MSHFEVVSLIHAIESVRRELKQLVIWHETGRGSIDWEFIRNWDGTVEHLQTTLEYAAETHPVIREALYRTGLQKVKQQAKVRATTSDDTKRPPPLTAKQKKAWDYIKAHPNCKGIMVAKHVGVSYEGFRSRYVPKLREHGVKNDDGYYVDEG